MSWYRYCAEIFVVSFGTLILLAPCKCCFWSATCLPTNITLEEQSTVRMCNEYATLQSFLNIFLFQVHITIWNHSSKILEISFVFDFSIMTLKVYCLSWFCYQVLDSRDPMGTRCSHIESFLKKEKQHKHLIFVLNKCDLVPTWVTVRILIVQ